MSDPKVDTPTETAPTETAETHAVEETITAPATQVVSPETGVISADPVVVAANLENAEPVENPGPATQTEGTTTEAAAAPAEETPAEATPTTPEKPKEGSAILNFIKKFPNPKTTDKKAGKAVAVDSPVKTEEAPAPTATEAPAPAVADEIEEYATVAFKTHGGFFGGGWKNRTIFFGKEDGYSKEILYPYIGIHKASSIISGADKTHAALSNAAHATVTGVGLLVVVKAKAVDVPLNIINLADVTAVTSYGANFTVKTSKSGDYEFGAGTIAKANVWKLEIEKRSEQAKLTSPAVTESEGYKEALTHYQGQKGHPTKTPEAVTSDEEGAVSGEEKRPSKWSRRISGSLGRLTGPSKEKEYTPEAKEVAAAPVAAEAAEAEAPTETAPVPETTVTEPPAETSAEPTPAESKKEKRKSFTGFGTLFNKNKVAKEPSPEPTTAEESKEDVPEVPVATETAIAETVIEPLEPTETPAVTETPKADKTKRASIFGTLRGRKDKSPALTNGEPTEPTTTEDPAPVTPEAVVPPSEETPATTSETKPETPKKEGLGRRLTSQFKAFGRAKSPDKSKTAKVSDEAPKIDTDFESTPETAAAPEPSAPVEPLNTTEAPPAPVDSVPSDQPASAPVVSTQA